MISGQPANRKKYGFLFIIAFIWHMIQREHLQADFMEDMEEETYPLTEIDRIANGTELLMLKALLPYLPSGGSPDFAMLIKFMEIRNIRKYYRNRPAANVRAMSAKTCSAAEILQRLALFCPKEQREALRQFRNAIDMAQMFGTMQDMFGGEAYGESEQSSEERADRCEERDEYGTEDAGWTDTCTGESKERVTESGILDE